MSFPRQAEEIKGCWKRLTKIFLPYLCCFFYALILRQFSKTFSQYLLYYLSIIIKIISILISFLKPLEEKRRKKKKSLKEKCLKTLPRKSEILLWFLAPPRYKYIGIKLFHNTLFLPLFSFIVGKTRENLNPKLKKEKHKKATTTETPHYSIEECFYSIRRNARKKKHKFSEKTQQSFSSKFNNENVYQG